MPASIASTISGASNVILAKLTHLVRYLGTPTLVVESGGRTPEGAVKLHVWWKLTEAAAGEDLAALCRLRGDIAMKVGGDTHFRSAHQPIRVAGSVYHKGGFQRVVQIREQNAVEVDVSEFAERVAAMTFIPGMGAEPPPEGHAKPSIDAILTTPVHEGGQDAWSRFEGASAAIGHYVRLVHEGKLSPNDGWVAIRQRNRARAVEYMNHHLQHIEAQLDLSSALVNIDFAHLFRKDGPGRGSSPAG